MSGYSHPTFRYYLGDFNNDFVVTQGDLDLVLSKYGTVYEQGDLDEVLAYFGRVYVEPPQPEPQPEPEPEPQPEPEPEPEPEAEPEFIPGFVIDGLVSNSQVKFHNLKTKNFTKETTTNSDGIYLFPEGLDNNIYYYISAKGGENINTQTDLGNKKYSRVSYLDLLDVSSSQYNINIFTTLISETVNNNITTSYSKEAIDNNIQQTKNIVFGLLGLGTDTDINKNYFDSDNYDVELLSKSTKLNSLLNILSHILPYDSVLNSIIEIINAKLYNNNFQFSNYYDSQKTLIDIENIDFIMRNVIGFLATEKLGERLYVERVFNVIDDIVLNNTALVSRLESINVFTSSNNVLDLSNNYGIIYDDFSNNFDNITYQLASNEINIYNVKEPEPEPEPEPESEPEPEPEYQHYAPDSFFKYNGDEDDKFIREVKGGASGIQSFYTKVDASVDENNNLIVSSNGIPNYMPKVGNTTLEGKWNNAVSTVDNNNNIIGQQNFVFNIPIIDVQYNPVTDLSDDLLNVQVTILHEPIGVSVNGVPFFNPFRSSIGEYYSNLRDVFTYGTFDSFGGYVTGPSTGVEGPGPYYYPGYPNGLESLVIDPSGEVIDRVEVGDLLDAQINKRGLEAHSPILGYMRDGYPIYGPIGTTSELFDKKFHECRVLKSSYRYFEKRNLVSQVLEDQGYEYVQGLGDLDKCNAIYSGTPEYPTGCYHYVLSIDASGSYVNRSTRTDLQGNQLYQYPNHVPDLSKNIIQSTYPHTTIFFRETPGNFTNLLDLVLFQHDLSYNNFELYLYYEPTYFVQDYDVSNVDLALKRWDEIVTSVPKRYIEGIPHDQKVVINVEFKLLQEEGVLGYNSTKKLLDLQNRDASDNSIIIDCEDTHALYGIINDNIGTKIPIENRVVMNTKYTSQLDSWPRNDGKNSYYYTFLHEVGHSLGIGSLWFLNGTKSTYVDEDDGQTKHVYTAQHGKREYQFYTLDLDTDLLYGIPIEDDGGHGTASVHPEEGDEGHISLDNRKINGVYHPGLNDELMKGFIEWGSEPLPLSRITIGFVEDVGFGVDYLKADHYEIDGYPHDQYHPHDD